MIWLVIVISGIGGALGALAGVALFFHFDMRNTRKEINNELR